MPRQPPPFGKTWVAASKFSRVGSRARITALIASAVLGVTTGCAGPPPTAAPDAPLPVTRPEATGYTETTRYDEVVGLLTTIADAPERAFLTTFGDTVEGRPLPLLVVGDVTGADAGAVRRSGRLPVWLQANIHGGEVCGKEALLMLSRALATGAHADWLDELVLLIAPIYNADGNERVDVENRPLQHGPVGGMGERPNAQGLNLNRDHTKLDSPEARALVAALDAYDPAVIVDLHTTNGTRHAYHLTYAPPLHLNTHPAIDTLLRSSWLPAVTTAVAESDGWAFYYYGNVGPAESPDRGWRTFDHRPRFNNSYADLRNRFGILSEAYSYATFEDRVHATRRFVEEVLTYAAGNVAPIRQAIATADAASVVGQTLAVRATPLRSDEPVEILMGDTIEEPHPTSGAVMLRRTDVRRPERMYQYGRFEASASERAPAAYYLPEELTTAVTLLEAHGIEVGRLDTDRSGPVERFVIGESSTSERLFEGHHERVVEGAWETTEMTLPAGTRVVAMDQPLGRLAFILIEPRSDDGLVNWNLLDEELEGAEVYPILRSRTPDD